MGRIYFAETYSSPEIFKMITYNCVQDCLSLYSNQEEADTRIILHAMHSDKVFEERDLKGRLVVKSPNTDVFVLLLHF